MIATNRINTPELAEKILAAGRADMVSLARPFLSDAAFGSKAEAGTPELINTCLACNQACLDHYFVDKTATCIVNPLAAHETKYDLSPAAVRKRIAVVGAGPAGLSCATVAAERGHHVTLFEQAGEIGGQFNLAKAVPGKQEFAETIRHYGAKIAHLGIDLKLDADVSAASLNGAFDDVVIATGVEPRRDVIEGEGHPCVASYADILSGRFVPGRKVALIGAGGIGFDVAVYLVEKTDRAHLDEEAFLRKWGIEREPASHPSGHDVVMLQRSEGAMGRHLGRTTGWVHKIALRNAGVRQVTGVSYRRIDDQGLHITVACEPECIAVDTVVICAGQVENAALADALAGDGRNAHLIGGAKEARELDAMRAIAEGVRIAAEI
jgi:2,4-dienoyl-CoA reductase (NADPH2)